MHLQIRLLHVHLGWNKQQELLFLWSVVMLLMCLLPRVLVGALVFLHSPPSRQDVSLLVWSDINGNQCKLPSSRIPLKADVGANSWSQSEEMSLFTCMLKNVSYLHLWPTSTPSCKRLWNEKQQESGVQAALKRQHEVCERGSSQLETPGDVWRLLSQSKSSTCKQLRLSQKVENAQRQRGCELQICQDVVVRDTRRLIHTILLCPCLPRSHTVR